MKKILTLMLTLILKITQRRKHNRMWKKLKDEIRNRMSEEDVKFLKKGGRSIAWRNGWGNSENWDREKELEEYFEDNHSIDIAESFEGGWWWAFKSVWAFEWWK